MQSKVNQAIVMVRFVSGTSPKTRLFMAENKMTRRACYGHNKYRYFSAVFLSLVTRTSRLQQPNGPSPYFEWFPRTTLRTVHLISFFILSAFCFADRGPRCIESEFVFVRDPSQSVLWDPMLVCVCYIINSYYEGFCWFYMGF